MKLTKTIARLAGMTGKSTSEREVEIILLYLLYEDNGLINRELLIKI